MSSEDRSAGEFIEQAREITRAGPICDDCLGRAFGRRGRGLANHERGEAVRVILSMVGGGARPGECWVCGGLLGRMDGWAERAAEAAEGLEFGTYLFGVRLSPRLAEMEAHFEERFPTGDSEPLKHALNRTAGKRFEHLFAGTTVDFEDPHLTFLIDLAADTIRMHVASVFVYGRYRKLVRGIPQTRWPCRRCRGRGCDACGFTGKQYPESVEEWIAAPFVEASRAKDDRFHGAGREDIDARMLGEGRPFVLELRAPKRRALDLVELRQTVNESAGGRVEVSRLSFVRRRAVEVVKETKASKTYRVRVDFAEEVSPDVFCEALRTLVGEIAQRTPQRVAHRRADLIRRRRVLAASGRLCDPTHAEIEFQTEGGLYVKELVSADDGRTVPSLAERIGVAASVTELDVIDVASAAFPDTPDEAVDIANGLP